MKIQLILLLSLFSGLSYAQKYQDAFTAGDLLALCNGNDSQQIECSAFVKGVRSGMHAQRLFLGFTLVKNKTDPPYILKPLLLNEPFCLPPEHTNENIVETVISFVNKLPKEKQNAGAGFSVILALNNAYPCK